MFLNNNDRCLIVAEISSNHGRSFDRAAALIKKAKEAGADAVKFQTYTPDTMTMNIRNKYFRIKHPRWGGQTLYDLYKKAYTPWVWFKRLKRIADDLGIMFFSTAFDKTSVDFLEELNVPVHKIASFELVDLPLVEYAARTGKPLILSTGMAARSEIRDALVTARRNAAKGIVLLKCVSSYPAEPKEMNLKTIGGMRESFKCPVGLSDHTLGTEISVAAVVLGACIIEKHFTLNRSVKGPDSFFSTQPDEMRILVDKVRLVEEAVGRVSYGATEGEKKNLIFRRSLFASSDIMPGELFTKNNIKSIRPGHGLKPKYLKDIMGRRAKKRIKEGTPLLRGMIK